MVFRTIIFFKNKTYFILCYSLSGIGNLYPYAFFLINLTYKNPFIVSGIIYSVIYQVVDNLLNFYNVASHRDFFVRLKGNNIIGPLWNSLVSCDDSVKHLGNAEFAVIELLIAVLKLRKIQYVVYKLRKPVGFLYYYFKMLVALYRIISWKISYHFRICLEHGKRRS